MDDIKELGTDLPLRWVAELDEENPTVTVDWNFIRLTLQAMNSLKKVAPDHIAEASIPLAKEYAEKLYLSIVNITSNDNNRNDTRKQK